jgi:hypothetical protein
VKVDRAEFLKQLKTCKPGVELHNAPLEGSDCFIFKKGRLYTYNGYISVSIPIAYDFECVISANELLKIVSSFKAKDIDIELKESSLLLISGRAKASINIRSETIYKQILTVVPTNPGWKPLPEGFGDALNRCYIRNMTVESASKIDGVFIDKNAIISTDRVVINHFKFYESMDRIWLTSKMISELIKFPELTDYVLQDSWAIFKSGDMIFACRRYVDDRYPIEQLKQVIANQKTDKMSGVLNADFRLAVANAVIFAQEKENRHFVNLEFMKDGIRVFSGTHSGSYDEFVDCAIEDWDHITISVDGEKLKQAMKLDVDIPFYIGYIEGEANAFIVHKDSWTELFFIYKE